MSAKSRQPFGKGNDGHLTISKSGKDESNPEIEELDDGQSEES
jgi:hypothetical protein